MAVLQKKHNGQKQANTGKGRTIGLYTVVVQVIHTYIPYHTIPYNTIQYIHTYIHTYLCLYINVHCWRIPAKHFSSTAHPALGQVDVFGFKSAIASSVTAARRRQAQATSGIGQPLESLGCNRSWLTNLNKLFGYIWLHCICLLFGRLIWSPAIYKIQETLGETTLMICWLCNICSKRHSRRNEQIPFYCFLHAHAPLG